MLTPQILAKNLSQQLGIDIYLKREDLHPYGSHKGRSIPLIINRYQKAGWRDFVISSSGNAALAAALAIKKYNQNHPTDQLTLKIFAGKNIDLNKLKIIKDKIAGDKSNTITIQQVANPKQRAFSLAKQGHAKFLRQSTDDSALIGYYELARELAKIKNLSAVFIPTSSGTTAQGLYESFKKLKLNPQIHIAQTSSCHPMIKERSASAEKSLATAIVDKVAHRKLKILGVIKNSHGAGWIASNKKIRQAMRLIKRTENLTISPNSALAIVGLLQANKQGFKFNNPVVCLITGK